MYQIAFLDQAITIITSATITSYFIYSLINHSEWFMLTIPFVIYGIFRLYNDDSQGRDRRRTGTIFVER